MQTAQEIRERIVREKAEGIRHTRGTDEGDDGTTLSASNREGGELLDP